MLTGRYPPGHGARDNGLRISSTVPTLAAALHARGFATAAFVAAFPLDHQFGLDRGFDVYGDRLPRGADGRHRQRAPRRGRRQRGHRVAAARSPIRNPQSANPQFFLWVHLFEPHAPYGDPSATSRPVLERYDDEIATADRETGRLLAALGAARAETLVVAAGDHGEAFGEHGEYAHSIFVYDTTLRVPLLMSGPGIPSGLRVTDPVTLADVAPTVMRALGAPMSDVDGIDLSPAFEHAPLPQRELYAESFAPLVEFGWAPLRAIRSGAWKLVAAPTPELFDIDADPAEQANVFAAKSDVARRLATRVSGYSTDSLNANGSSVNDDAAQRLRALGYSSPSNNLQGTSPPEAGSERRVAISSRESRRSRRASSSVRPCWRLSKGSCATIRATARRSCAWATRGWRQATARARSRRSTRRQPPGSPPQTCLWASPRAWAGAAIFRAPSGLWPRRGGLNRTIRSSWPTWASCKWRKAICQARSGRSRRPLPLIRIFTKPGSISLWCMRDAGRAADAAATARELLQRLPAGAPQRVEVERLLKALQ